MSRELRVWAPTATTVAVLVGDERHEMARDGCGWWHADVDAPRSAPYRFSVDGAAPVPDPRAASQPEGVDGPSVEVDHGGFEWHDQGWTGCTLEGAVLYECHVGTFSEEGTFDGVAARLGYLADLGVTAIELLPVATFPGARGWGYDGVALFAPHPAYGGPEGLKRLVDAAHAVGLGVLLDVVYNHLGPHGNHLASFAPYFTDRHLTEWGSALNYEEAHSTGVRRFVVDNALTWVRDYHVDGLRLDAVHAIVDRSAVHVLEQLTGEVRALAASLGRDVVLIAECDLNDPRYVRAPSFGGYGFDAAWADEWHHALHAVLTGEREGYYVDFGSLESLEKALRQAWVHDGTWSVFRERLHGRPPVSLRGDQFVVSTQTHDQVGNRAKGDRLASLTSHGRVKVAAALLLTAPFVPMLFQGEEWGSTRPFCYFADHEDPHVAEEIRDGRRAEFSAFGWSPDELPDPGAIETFRSSVLDWDECSAPGHADVLEWYRTLLSLRREHPELSDPDPASVTVTCDPATGHVEVVRGGALAVHANLGASSLTVASACAPLACSSPEVIHRDGALLLPPDTTAIVPLAAP